MGIIFGVHENDPEDLDGVIYQALGAGSTCWIGSLGLGEFDTKRAGELAEEVIAWINEHFELKEEYK